MNREEMIAKIEALYAGRMSGDQSAFSTVLAPDAEFKFAGDKSIVSAFPGGDMTAPNAVAQALFEQIDMLSLERVADLVEGSKVAVLFKGVLQAKGGEPFEHFMFDLWEFDEDGRICRGTQYQDTAKIIIEMGGSLPLAAE